MSMLVADGVKKGFGGVQALDGVTLDVEQGLITALIGPNGAGKTTFFNALTGFADIDSGSIAFQGRQIERLSPWKIARLGMGRTFQTPTGFPLLTVWENLMVAASEPQGESFARALLGPRRWRDLEGRAASAVAEALEQLGLTHLADTVMSELTAGDAKLVELGRQVLRKPELLLLDEPAAGVDASQLGVLVDRLRDLRTQGVSIVLIDHNLSFVLEVADFVYVLALGRVIASGPPAEVASHPDVIEIYIGESHGAA
jgi:ABC-type branched-subunit amino acid transport system ATPase component